MARRRLFSWFLQCILGGCICLLLAGCLDAEKTVLILYDAPTDAFHYLVIYQRLRGVPVSKTSWIFSGRPATAPATKANDDGTDDLRALQKQHDGLVAGPFPTTLWIDLGLIKGPNGKGHVCNLLDLSTPTDDAGPAFDTRGIRAIPGTFFKQGDGDLCYSQSVILPGNIMDRWIDALNQQIAKQPPDFQPTIDAKKAPGAKPMSWAEAGKYIADGLRKYDGEDDPLQNPPSSMPLSIRSLQMLQDQANRHQLNVRRRGAVLSLSVRLMPADVDGVMQIIGPIHQVAEDRLEALRDPAVENSIKNPPDGAECVRVELAMVYALSCTRLDRSTLRVDFDLIRFCTDGSQPLGAPLPDLKEDADWARTTAAAAEDAVPIDRKMTVTQLREDFASGKVFSAMH